MANKKRTTDYERFAFLEEKKNNDYVCVYSRKEMA
jgi:hypothetical protein